MSKYLHYKISSVDTKELVVEAIKKHILDGNISGYILRNNFLSWLHWSRGDNIYYIIETNGNWKVYELL